MKRFIGRLILKLIGWEILGERPPHDKFVLIAAPHTSNWDLPIMLSIALVFDIKLHWIGKHTLFRFPYGWFMRFLGGIPIDRRAPQGMVGQVADAFRNSEKLVIVVPPEGTRGRAEYWKSGFYWMAKEAGVPWLGTQSDQSSLAPDLVVANQVYDWNGVLTDMIAKIQAGELGGTAYVLTLENGGLKVVFNDGYATPDDVKTAAEEAIQGVIDGSITTLSE